jgi:hypothetical protein
MVSNLVESVMGGSESLRACPNEDREIDNRASTNSFFIIGNLRFLEVGL